MSGKSNQPLTGTILVADDQAANRELLEELLTAEGFKVASVSTGAAALEQLSLLPIDLVLPDVCPISRALKSARKSRPIPIHT